MQERLKVTHDPTDSLSPWTAELYYGDTPAGIRGYGATKNEAVESAREKWIAQATKQPDEWIDL